MEASDYTEIDLRILASTIWKRWWVILQPRGYTDQLAAASITF